MSARPALVGAAALVLALAAGYKAAHLYVYDGSHWTAWFYGLFMVALLIVVGSILGGALTASWFWSVLHFLAIWTIETIVAALLGFLAITWAGRAAAPVKVETALVVGVLAGVAPAALAVLLTALAWFALWLIQLVRPTLGPPATDQLGADAYSWFTPAKQAYLRRYVATAVGGTAASLLVQSIAYHQHWSSRLADVTLPIVAWLVGGGIAWFAASRASSLPPGWHTKHLAMRAVGLASLLLAAALVTNVWSAASAADAALLRVDGAPTPSFVYPAGISDAALARMFAPRLRYASDEPFPLTSVKWYRGHSIDFHDYRPDATARLCEKPHCRALVASTGPDDRAASVSGCDGIDARCVRDASSAPTAYVVYPPARSMPPQFASVTRLIQYWFFSNFDSFDRWLISQWHEADWEQVTIGFSDERTPVFVAYSEHCYGTYRRWPAVPVVDRTHPLVWVASGTHANYPRSIEAPLRGSRCLGSHPPRYFGIAGVAAGLVEIGGGVETAGDFAFGETDHTGGVDVRPHVDTTGYVKTLGGTRWGLDNHVKLADQPASHSDAPLAPTDHPEAKDVAKQILCNPKWIDEPRLPCQKTTAGKRSRR